MQKAIEFSYMEVLNGIFENLVLNKTNCTAFRQNGTRGGSFSLRNGAPKDIDSGSTQMGLRKKATDV